MVRIAGVLLATSGCIIPFGTPPLKADLGGGTRVGRNDDRNASSLHVAAGTHLASGTRDDTQRFDVGAGYTLDMTKDDYAHGLYLDAAYFIDRSGHRRTSAGARTEVRWVGEGRAVAAKLRIDTELFKPGVGTFDGDDKCGTMAGTYYGTSAIGVFVEAGRIWEPDVMSGGGGDAWIATAGVTLRLPSALGLYIGIPGCK